MGDLKGGMKVEEEKKNEKTKAERLAEALAEAMELPDEEREGFELFAEGVRAGLMLARRAG